MSTTTMTEYVGAAEDLPEDLILGRMVVFKVPTTTYVPHVQAPIDIASHQLRTTTLRDAPRAVDAYKRAMRILFDRRWPPTDDHRVEFETKPIGRSDKEASFIHVMREVKEYGAGRRKRISYDPIVEANFDRSTNGGAAGATLTITRLPVSGIPLNAAQNSFLDAAIAEATDRINFEFAHHNHIAIRRFFRDYITDLLNGFRIKDSMYFVAREHTDELDRLRRYAESIGCVLRTIPLLDLVDGREMLTDHLQDDIMGQARAQMDKIAKVLTSGDATVSQRDYDRYQQSALDLWEKLHNHSDILGTKVDQAAITLKTYKDQVLKLTSRIAV